MTTCPSQLAYRSLRAPREDGAALVEPPLADVAALVGRNVQLSRQHDYDFHGRSLGDLAGEARLELVEEARRWTEAYRDVDLPSGDTDTPIYLAGHQPQLFHPGVWFKNFALGRLARRDGAIAVNLLIDSDTVKGSALKVPVGSVAKPRTEAVPFDRPETAIPYEERQIVDSGLFGSFGRRVAQHVAALVDDPLIRDYWPMACSRRHETRNLGACLAQSRHQLEGRWGLQALEIPQSRVCESMSFCWFVAHLLARLPQLWTVYNEAVHEYRRAHRLRSATHPAPDLAARGPWLEAPLWIWTTDDPQRRRLFARHDGRETVLWDGDKLEIRVPLTPDGDAERAAERLMELRHSGVKIRSRALITTLWARLVLGDLFLHGIGGAKYDHVTDVLIERFFGLRPPELLILSATLHLPIRRPPVHVDEAHGIRQQLRRLQFHPERFIDGNENVAMANRGGLAELIAVKERWIRTPQTRRNARTRCRAIRRVNEALQPWVESRRRGLLRREARTDRALQAEAVLASREYGFCLHPEESLREFLRRLLP